MHQNYTGCQKLNTEENTVPGKQLKIPPKNNSDVYQAKFRLKVTVFIIKVYTIIKVVSS